MNNQTGKFLSDKELKEFAEGGIPLVSAVDSDLFVRVLNTARAQAAVFDYISITSRYNPDQIPDEVCDELDELWDRAAELRDPHVIDLVAWRNVQAIHRRAKMLEARVAELEAQLASLRR